MSDRFGKYRGTVLDNHDPNGQGRAQVSVPAVSADAAWALPSSPYAGPGVGLLSVPPVGANVWVEYEGGDTAMPIWSGCFWAVGEAPQPAAGSAGAIVVLQTQTCTLTLSDLEGAQAGITIELTTGARITLGSEGVEISDGQGASVTLQGPKVTVNEAALEVS